MRISRKILPVLAGAAFFLALNALLNILFIPYQFTRMKVHRIETERFEDLVLGSSHGCAAIDPAVLSDATGRSCFNAAAGGQYPRENLYLLRDACRAHAPERVIYEYDPAYWIAGDDFNRNARYQLDVMAPSAVKAAYFADLCLRGDIRYVLMPWFLYADSFGRAGENLRIRMGEAYRTYGTEPFASGNQICREDGFTAIAEGAEGDMQTPELSFSEENAGWVEKNNLYFTRLASACAGQGIDLVVVTTPVPEQTLQARHDFYVQAHAMMAELAAAQGFVYLDCALPREEGGALEGPPRGQEAFSDAEGHMYAGTAEEFTRQLAALLPEA